MANGFTTENGAVDVLKLIMAFIEADQKNVPTMNCIGDFQCSKDEVENSKSAPTSRGNEPRDSMGAVGSLSDTLNGEYQTELHSLVSNEISIANREVFERDLDLLSAKQRLLSLEEGKIKQRMISLKQKLDGLDEDCHAINGKVEQEYHQKMSDNADKVDGGDYSEFIGKYKAGDSHEALKKLDEYRTEQATEGEHEIVENELHEKEARGSEGAIVGWPKEWREKAPRFCRAACKTGNQCKNRALYGDFCQVHKAHGEIKAIALPNVSEEPAPRFCMATCKVENWEKTAREEREAQPKASENTCHVEEICNTGSKDGDYLSEPLPEPNVNIGVKANGENETTGSEGAEALPNESEVILRTYCKAICKSGKRCKNPSKNGDYCWKHSPEPKTPTNGSARLKQLITELVYKGNIPESLLKDILAHMQG